MNKEFKSSNGVIITRGDYESLPLPLKAKCFSDEQMQTLVNNIDNELKKYGYSDDDISKYFGKCSTKEEDEFDTNFWVEMENCAIDMGMEYY